jgi:hypothetical protein
MRGRAKAATLGEDEVRRRIASHLVDYDDLAAGDFERFIDNRAQQMSEVMAQVCSGHVWP